jgi:hypothetical protein
MAQRHVVEPVVHFVALLALLALDFARPGACPEEDTGCICRNVAFDFELDGCSLFVANVELCLP